jgi:hypothetical protein
MLSHRLLSGRLGVNVDQRKLREKNEDKRPSEEA